MKNIMGSILGYGKEFVGSTVEQQADRINILITDRPGLLIDHFREILITHSKLFVKPVFRFAVLFKKLKDV